MRVFSGKVVRGKVVVDGAHLAEGAVVTVLLHVADEPFGVSRADEAALLAVIAEADRGDAIPAETVIARLRRGG